MKKRRIILDLDAEAEQNRKKREEAQKAEERAKKKAEKLAKRNAKEKAEREAKRKADKLRKDYFPLKRIIPTGANPFPPELPEPGPRIPLVPREDRGNRPWAQVPSPRWSKGITNSGDAVTLKDLKWKKG